MVVALSGGAASLIAFWVVLGTAVLKVKDNGKSEPCASGIVGSWVIVSSIVGVLCLVAWVVCPDTYDGPPSG